MAELSTTEPVKVKLKLLGKIKSGAYGTVYKTNDPQLVCKVNQYDDCCEDGYTRDFLREISALSSLSGSNYIAQLYGVNAENLKSLRIFMQRYQKDLKSLIDQTQKFDLDTIKRIIHQILIGIYNAQLKGISHRDLKPANILLDSNGEIAICDWGLSRFMGTGDPQCFSEEVITLWYRPPEILLGGKYSFSADIWSIGVILCELINGRHFLPGKTNQDQLELIFEMFGYPNQVNWQDVEKLRHYPKKIKPMKIYPLSHHLEKIDSVCLDLISKMLQINPHYRIDIWDAINHPYFDSVRSESLITDPRSDRLFDSYIDLNRQDALKPILQFQTHINRQFRIHAIKLMFKMLKGNQQRYPIFFKSCHYFDLFLSVNPDQLEEHTLILAGLTCLWIASKVVGLHTIDCEKLTDINGFDMIELIEMEMKVVKLLNYQLYRPTEDDYLRLLQQSLEVLSSSAEKKAYQLLSSAVYDLGSRFYQPYHLALLVYLKVLGTPNFEMNYVFSLVQISKSEYIEIHQYIKAFDHMVLGRKLPRKSNLGIDSQNVN